MSEPRKIVCVHCGAEVFWSFPRPEDPCLACGKPIAVKQEPISVKHYRRPVPGGYELVEVRRFRDPA